MSRMSELVVAATLCAGLCACSGERTPSAPTPKLKTAFFSLTQVTQHELVTVILDTVSMGYHGVGGTGRSFVTSEGTHRVRALSTVGNVVFDSLINFPSSQPQFLVISSTRPNQSVAIFPLDTTTPATTGVYRMRAINLDTLGIALDVDLRVGDSTWAIARGLQYLSATPYVDLKIPPDETFYLLSFRESATGRLLNSLGCGRATQPNTLKLLRVWTFPLIDRQPPPIAGARAISTVCAPDDNVQRAFITYF